VRGGKGQEGEITIGKERAIQSLQSVLNERLPDEVKDVLLCAVVGVGLVDRPERDVAKIFPLLEFS
jgi:hypothetical protein